MAAAALIDSDGTSVRSSLLSATRQLSGSETPRLDAEVLLAHALGKPRSWVMAHSEELLTSAQAEEYRELIRRRAVGEPVAYLRGCVEWGDLELRVSPAVLIPRPETEQVAETVVELAVELGATVIADIGTGTGNIAIHVALNVFGSRVYAVERSAESLSVAHDNVARYRLEERVTLLAGNLLEPIPQKPDLIVANLPYLSNDMLASVPKPVAFEPRFALQGGSTGLECYEEMFGQMRVRDWRIPAVIEIDPRQAEGTQTLMKEVLGASRVDIRQDYSGRARIAVAREYLR